MVGQKRTRSGAPKPETATKTTQPQDITMTDAPPCAQAQSQSSKTSASPAPETNTRKPNTKQPSTGKKPIKRPLLPPNTTLTKRPLHHPALPSPFSSSTSPKIFYITASTPFIPACKRIRALLLHAAKRSAQSASETRGRRGGNNNSSGGGKARGRGRGRGLEANGRLEARDVEALIAESAREKLGKSTAGGEYVYLKATGRAIPRALEVGVAFQADGECVVRVEMGNLRAIDDVEVNNDVEGGGEDEGEEVPETRIRTLSTVTVCIGLK